MKKHVTMLFVTRRGRLIDEGGMMNNRNLREASQFSSEEESRGKPGTVDTDSYLDLEEAEKQIDDFRRKWKDLDFRD